MNSSEYKIKIYDKLNSKYYLIGINDNINGLFKKNETVIIDYELNANFNTLSLLSYSEETSINNSKIGKLNIYDKNKKFINSVDLVYLGSKISPIPNEKTIIYLIPFISV